MDFVRHRIVDASGLLGRDRTPWGSPRPAGRGLHGEPCSGGMPDPGMAATRPRLPVCECADVRAWLGPRRTGRRELQS
ncbi:MAG: hypothetical protein ACRDJO_04215 [Actinomycetota bacterium]